MNAIRPSFARSIRESIYSGNPEPPNVSAFRNAGLGLPPMQTTSASYSSVDPSERSTECAPGTTRSRPACIKPAPGRSRDRRERVPLRGLKRERFDDGQGHVDELGVRRHKREVHPLLGEV